MTLGEILSISASILVSLGGAGFIIVSLSTWLGKVWAERILEKYKSELQLSNSSVLRYSESQFALYNELWISLSKLRTAANYLWEEASWANLQGFIFQLEETAQTVERSELLIEDEHLSKLQGVLETFSRFRLGKSTLIDLKDIAQKEASVEDLEIKKMIVSNRKSKVLYEKLLKEISRDLKQQIRGK